MIYRLIVRCLAVLILIFFNRGAAATISSEHYKLGVGQEECSTTISRINVPGINPFYKVAVTADIGSSSLKADPKYVSGYNYEVFAPILRCKHLTTGVNYPDLFAKIEEPEKKRPPRSEDDGSRSPSLRGYQLEQSDKKLPTTSLTGESTFEGSFDFLISQLQNVNLWIVFLSHPDKDHINWLTPVFNELGQLYKIAACCRRRVV